MKKIYLILIICLPLFCSCQKQEKLIIEKSNQKINSFIYLNETELINSFEYKKDFVLFVGSTSCSSCESAHTFIENYISSTSKLIYYCDYYVFNEKIKPVYETEEYLSGTLLFIKNGKVYDNIEYSKKNYSSQSYFNSLLSKCISNKSYTILNDFKNISVKKSWNDLYTFDYFSSVELENTLNSLSYTAILISTKFNPIFFEEYKEDFSKEGYFIFYDFNNLSNYLLNIELKDYYLITK